MILVFRGSELNFREVHSPIHWSSASDITITVAVIRCNINQVNGPITVIYIEPYTFSLVHYPPLTTACPGDSELSCRIYWIYIRRMTCCSVLLVDHYAYAHTYCMLEALTGLHAATRWLWGRHLTSRRRPTYFAKSYRAPAIAWWLYFLAVWFASVFLLLTFGNNSSVSEQW